MSDSGMLQTYALLIAQAIAPIILGSFKSLKTPKSVRTLRKSRKSSNSSSKKLGEADSDDESDTDADADQDETLTWVDTLLFPVMGSVVLLGFYAILKYVGKEWINLILGVYSRAAAVNIWDCKAYQTVSGAGMFAIQSTFGTLVSFLLRTLGVKPTKYHIRISSSLRQVFHSSITLPSLLLIPFSIAIPALYIPLGRPYIISNIIALSLSTATLQLLRLDSFATAGLLLGVLLIYDIFWVFATPVMVTVAKGLDAPIKLLAPRPSSTSPTGFDFAMLGLGDVVVPGLMVALCLRFDLAQAVKRSPGKEIGPRSRTKWSKPYFTVAVFSYLIGLVVTMAVMTHFKKAQPALLYLSPACILGPVLLGLARGEVKDMWAYIDAGDDKAEAARDETIEAGSEVAQKARAEAKARESGNGVDKVTSVDAASGKDDEAVSGDDAAAAAAGDEAEDDSWMEGSAGVGTAGQDGKARKRKSKKK